MEPIIRKVQPYEPNIVFEWKWFNRIAGFLFGVIVMGFIVVVLVVL